jgi:hypothetical protein
MKRLSESRICHAKVTANPPRMADLTGNDTDVIKSGRTKTRAYALELLGVFILSS